MQQAFVLMAADRTIGRKTERWFISATSESCADWPACLLTGFRSSFVHHVHPIAAKAYDDLCSSQGVTFGEGHSVRDLGITIVVFAVPIFLARSNALIVANLIVGLTTILGASALLHTAGNTPYECFTTMGMYEDNTSGLDGFEFWLVVAACFRL